MLLTGVDGLGDVETQDQEHPVLEQADDGLDALAVVARDMLATTAIMGVWKRQHSRKPMARLVVVWGIGGKRMTIGRFGQGDVGVLQRGSVWGARNEAGASAIR